MREKKDGLLALSLMQVCEMFDGDVQLRMKCSFKVQRSEGPSHVARLLVVPIKEKRPRIKTILINHVN
jgi:hypothetical protein